MTVTGARVRQPIMLGTIALGAATAALLLATRALHVWHGGARSIEQVVELSIEAAATICAGWISVGAAVGLLYTLSRQIGRDWRLGRAFITRFAPRAVRRMAGVVVTAGVGIGIATPCAFAATDPGAEPHSATPPAVVIDLGWQPTPETAAGGTIGDSTIGGGTGVTQPGQDRLRDPERRTLVDRRARHGTPRDDGAPVLVQRGDTLWSIATEHLLPDEHPPSPDAPDPARIVRHVTAWHATNRDVIGPDPDLIRPGMALRAPTAQQLGAQP